MTITAPISNPLRSDLAGDPDMLEIIQSFVEEMPDKVTQLESLWKDQRLDDLRRMAHQLKGAGSGYGFPSITQAAGAVEALLTAMGHDAKPGGVDDLRSKYELLVSLCRRVAM